MRSIVLAGVFGFSIAVTPSLAGAQTPVACALLGEQEALSLVGGPLDEIARAAAKQAIAKLP